jgi:antitoxin (DNA-binding transcriptional repressor) of toxin-antitoxin stability system
LTFVKAVAVKELKNRLSAYLREVRSGEVVLVTDRGRVVAELRQPTSGAAWNALDEALERLRVQGILVAGLPQDPRAYRPSPLEKPVRTADLLAAERGDR